MSSQKENNSSKLDFCHYPAVSKNGGDGETKEDSNNNNYICTECKRKVKLPNNKTTPKLTDCFKFSCASCTQTGDHDVIEVQPVIAVEEKKKKKPKKPLHLKYRGFFFTIMSSLCFSLTAVVVKKLHAYHPVTVALWRFQGAFLPALPLILCHHLGEKKKEKSVDTKEVKFGSRGWWKSLGILVLRSIFTCNALLLHFYSLQYLPVGDALVILCSTPVFAYFFAYILLGEPIGYVPVATSVTTLAGVAFILRPPLLTGGQPLDYNTLVGTGLAVGATLLATISYVLLRYSRRMHYSITTFFFGAWGTAENLALALALSVFSLPQGITDWWLAGALVALSFFGQISIILALKYEKCGPVTLIKTCDVVFGFLWQVIFWKAAPDLCSSIGALIVILGVVIIAFRKWIATLSEDDFMRRKLWFMLK